MRKIVVLLLAGLVSSASAEIIISTNSTWKYFKGTSEASEPTNAWREVAFDDSAWLVGDGPFHYGTNLAGGDDNEYGGTILSDMRSNYTCVFLRQPFFVENTNLFETLSLGFYFDDGFGVWINGVMARSPIGMGLDFSHTSRASSPNREANTFYRQNISTAIPYLVNGTNVLCIQAFDGPIYILNDDFRIDVQLEATFKDIFPPVITNVSPTPGTTVTNLSEITIQFNEEVTGVVAPDLLLNGNPCSGVAGSGNTYTYIFTQPLAGRIQIDWDINHTVADLLGNRFDETSPSATWEYVLVDGTSPTLAWVAPVPGATLSTLTNIEVVFNEPVLGVDAGDLRINGQPAQSVVPSASGGYLFRWTNATPVGLVTVSWAPGHGITDQAPLRNPFAAADWSYTHDPAAVYTNIVVINEFSAHYLAGTFLDEDRTQQDWIELYNRGSTAVRLLGWSLTTDPAVPGLWTFPDLTLGAGQYLVVFASGKDRTGVTNHTNFRLNQFGEYLGLYNADLPRQVVSEYAPAFPEQRADMSYGYAPNGSLVYFTTPTPRFPNPSAPVYEGMAAAPAASVNSGFFNQPFAVTLSTETPGAVVRYTLDGREPTATDPLYAGPIAVAGTASKAVVLLRAAAFRTGWLSSRVTTRTYIFPDYVVNQPNNPPGFPTIWDSSLAGKNSIPADYEMDPDVLGMSNNVQTVRQGLTELPAISIVTDINLLFGPAQGVYVRRQDWNQQPVNAEMIFPDGREGFNAPCGFEIQGGTSPNDQGSTWKSKKLSLRMLFKGEFGDRKLNYKVFDDSPVESFNTLVLDAHLNHAWHYNGGSSTEQQRQTAVYVRDTFVSDSQIAASGVSAHWRPVHVYLNGVYWGTYNLHERPDDHFAAAYFGGDDTDYDALRHNANNILAGDNVAFNTMFSIARSGVANNSVYENLQQYLDLPWFIDYMIINFWVGNNDWAHQNWYACRRREPGAGFRFISWDAEHTLEDAGYNRLTATSNRQYPLELYDLLRNNAEFRLLFADHVHKHFFNGGIFDWDRANPVWTADHPERNVAANRFMKRINELWTSLVNESARWGDSGNYNTDRSNNPLLRDRDMVLQLNALMGWATTSAQYHSAVNNYFPNRGNTVLNQCRDAGQGVYPTLAAPAFSQHGGRVPSGYSLYITNVAGAGTVYYTLNGTDPRVYGTSEVSPLAVAASAGVPVPLTRTVQVKARCLDGTTWSALNEALFLVNELGVPLRFTEIMYNPRLGRAYEFVELAHVGEVPLDVSNYTFEDEQGIRFTFKPGTVLPPGAVIVLGSQFGTNEFMSHYPNVVVAGWFEGSLDNAGERIAVRDASGQVVISVEYDNANGWPTRAAGLGSSLEIVDVEGSPNDPANWRASSENDGTPGLRSAPPALGDIVINEIMATNRTAVPNAGTYPDWIELYNRGTNTVSLANWSLTDDGNPRKFVFPVTNLDAGAYLVVWCDTNTLAPGLHTGFALGARGESVFLYDANTNRVDAAGFGPQIPDFSVGRLGRTWNLTQPTPGATNQPASLASATNLVINEWLASSPGGPDWIELHNPSLAAPVALRGLYLGTSNALFQIRSLGFVPAGGYVQLFADEEPNPDSLDFRLPKEGGMIVLYDSAGAEVNRVTYGLQMENVTEGRLPNGSVTVVQFPISPSPGASNYVATWTGPRLNEVMARNQSAFVGPHGRYADWIELENPNADAFDLSGMRLGESAVSADGWVIPAGASIAGNGRLLIWCDGSAPAATNAAGPLNTGFSLNGSGGGVYLFNDLGQRVDGIEYGPQLPDMSIGLRTGTWRLLATPTPGDPNSTFALRGSAANVRINEWLASATGGPDWFELYNPDPLPVRLDGLFLTDDPSLAGIAKFAIPPLSFIAAHGWVRYIADGAPAEGSDHADFALNRSAGTIRMYGPLTNLIDAVDYELQATNVSQGRLPDGAATVVSFPDSPSPGGANYLPLTNVVISEVLAHTDPPFEDAIEIRNLSTNEVNIGEWFLSDSESDLRRYLIPAGTILPPNGFMVFYEYQFSTNDGTHPGFTLNSAHGDQVHLSQGLGNDDLSGYRTSVSFGASANRVSIGRHQTSVGTDFVALSARTFGADDPGTVEEFRGGTGASNAYPQVGPLVINEVMYHPVRPDGTENADDEFIELHNISGASVDLYDPDHATNRWKLAGGVEFEFPATNLAAGAYLLLVRFDPADFIKLANFLQKYNVPPAVAVHGPWSGRLDNAGEDIELYRPDTPQTSPPDAGFVPYILVERVRYDDAFPWPTNGVDGGGASLQRIAASLYGNDPANWEGEAPTAGQPNGASTNAPPIVVVPPQSQTAITGHSVTFTVVASGTPPLTYQWQFNGGDIPDATADSYEIPLVTTNDQGSYRVRVSNAFGTNTTAAATLTVIEPAGIVSLEPPTQSVLVGAGATFTVVASGTRPLTYQWFHDGTLLPDAESDVLVLASVTVDDAGGYQAVVSNTGGAVTSAVVTLIVQAPPDITLQPASQTVMAGSDVTFMVAATGDAPLYYEWYVNSNLIASASGPSLTVTNVQLADDGNSYIVVVNNAVGSMASSPAFLTVLVKPILQEVEQLDGGYLKFIVNGQPGRSYLIESSTNLLNLATGTGGLGSMLVTNGQTVILDMATNGVQQFYRARVAP